jgi:hypothetical protein
VPSNGRIKAASYCAGIYHTDLTLSSIFEKLERKKCLKYEMQHGRHIVNYAKIMKIVIDQSLIASSILL